MNSFSMNVNIDLKDLRLDTPRAESLIEDRLFLGVTTIASNISKSIQTGAKTGRVYKRGNVYHQASSAGQPPASDTGRLAGSSRAVKTGKKTHVKGVVETVYAQALELGSSKIAPRPFVRPAVDRAVGSKLFERLLADVVGEL